MRADAIRVARVPARLSGAPRLRQVLERWLADSDLARHGFPPRAVVLVRRLSARWADIAGDARGARYGELAALLAQARRPAAGEIGADVVWFENEAELLACMARDSLSGALSTRWWWRVLLRGEAPRDAAVAHWLEGPRVVPRALQRLDRRTAGAWIASWAPREQLGLLRRLAQAFPIAPQVVAYVHAATLSPDAAAAGRPGSVQARAAGATGVAVVEGRTSSRAERLLRLCADLARDASAAGEARHALRMASQLADVAPSLPPATQARSPAAWPPTAGPRHRSSRVVTPASDDADRVVPRSPRAARPMARPAFMPPVRSEPRDASPPIVTPAGGPGAEASRPAPPDAAPRRQGFTEATDVSGPQCPAAFDTRHGGLLFLLNVALELSLYGDFTRPLQRGLPCTPWRFLLMAGRAWCGPAFRADPLGEWLTLRDAAARFAPDPIDEWRLPVPWLAPFAEAEGVWCGIWQCGRLRLVHPAGFTVLEVPATLAQCDALVAAEMARLGIAHRPPVRQLVVSRSRHAPARGRAGGHRHGCPNALWPYLRARLALALGLADGASAKCRLAAAMLRLPARLHDGGERVDLHLPLDALPVAVRIAGLDRDPGWIPAAGCDVRFHFH